MKKNVLVFGLIAGLIITLMMVITSVMCYSQDNFEGNMLLGYATMIIAFSMIFVGIKNYRDKHNGGIISFAKAFKIGLYITLIASTMYVLVWLVEYYLFFPDFMERYTDHVIRNAKNSGATPKELQAQVNQMASYKEMYKNPVFVVLLTYAEVLPVGLLISVIAALILKRKQNVQDFATI